jgi:hypothetical protein
MEENQRVELEANETYERWRLSAEAAVNDRQVILSAEVSIVGRRSLPGDARQTDQRRGGEVYAAEDHDRAGVRADQIRPHLDRSCEEAAPPHSRNGG